VPEVVKELGFEQVAVCCIKKKKIPCAEGGVDMTLPHPQNSDYILRFNIL